MSASRTRGPHTRAALALTFGLTLVLGTRCTDAPKQQADAPAASASDTVASDALGSTDSASSRVDLTGAGASFPYPLYARWFNDYAGESGVRINYRSIGSAEGIREIVAGTADFGATDVPMTDAELASAPAPILHVPTALGAVALVYNLPALSRPLRLSADVIADIFLGRITRWSDPRIQALNAEMPAVDESIRVVHRSEGSGTSYILSDYLSAVSPAWKAGPGRGRDVVWPTGTGGAGNEGVAGAVKQAQGSIGYVEVVYARQNRLRIAHVRNRAGRFVSPMPFEIASASRGALRMAGAAASGTPGVAAPDLRVSIVNAPDDQAYPIASFTWMLIAPSALGPVKTRQLTDFLRWALLEHGDTAAALGYVALPTEAASRVLDGLDAAPGRASGAAVPR